MKKKYLFIIMALFAIMSPLLAQDSVIERKYHTTFYDKYLSCYRDTTCSIFFTLKSGSVSDVSMFVATYDRTHVQTAKISFNGNNLENLASFLKTLEKSKEKYLEWSKTARENNVAEFIKDMDNKSSIKKHRMEISFCYDSLWYKTLTSNDRGLPMPLISPVFKVDKGELLLEIGQSSVLGERFSPKQRTGYIPSIWSAILTETVDRPVSGARTGQIAIQFRNEDQILSFLDAFNIDNDVIRIRQEYKNKKNEQESLDELFK